MTNESKKRCPHQGCGCVLCCGGDLRKDRNPSQEEESVPLPTRDGGPSKKTNNDENNKEKRKEYVRKGAGGPTTDAGRKKKAEAEAAKAAKKELQQERNRKKRDAYRERQRAKKTMPSSREQARRDRDRTQRNGADKNKSTKAKERTKKHNERRHNNNKDEARHQLFPNGTFDEATWEKLMAKALQNQNFDKMRDLFMADFEFVLVASSSRSSVTAALKSSSNVITKRYRVLSCRFHPDKNVATEEGEQQYKIAFQALNEAYGRYSSWF